MRTSHSRTARSSPAVASIAPSGLNAADQSRPRFLFSVWMGTPAAVSQSRAVPSLLALASIAASGLNTTE